MKQEISSFELKCIIDELQEFVDGKIDKISQPEKNEIVLQLYKTGIGKQLLRIIPGKFLYITDFKGSSPIKPFGYCLFLRKHLDSAKIVSINQIGFERILEIILEKKDKRFKFIVEFFDKGNIIVCDMDNKIISPLQIQKWEKRTIMAGKIYDYPKKEHNFLGLDQKGLEKLLKDSKQTSLVKSLAIDLGLGGVYAEEVCLLSKIDKNIKPNQADTSLVFKGIEKLRKAKVDPYIIKKEGKVKDIVPIKLNLYAEFENIKIGSYNKSLDSVLTQVNVNQIEKETQKEHTTKLSKATKLITVQEKQLKKLESDYEENNKKGEFIFENYQKVKDILDQMTIARKTMSWDEIKKRLKGNKMITNIDEKTGEIEVEL